MSVPTEYICPLTLDLMIDPVVSRHGHTYERKAILEWLVNNDCCPMTRKPLKPSNLISYKKLKQEILQWKICNAPKNIPISNDDDDACSIGSSQESSSAPPEEFICPLSGELMKQPVMSRDGRNYDRSSIIAWFEDGHNFCPLTGKPLKLSGVISNRVLEIKIREWKEECKMQKEHESQHLYHHHGHPALDCLSISPTSTTAGFDWKKEINAQLLLC